MKKIISVLFVVIGLLMFTTSVFSETYRTRDGRYVLTVNFYGNQIYYQIDDNKEQVCLSSDSIIVEKNSNGTYSVNGQTARNADQAFTLTKNILMGALGAVIGSAFGPIGSAIGASIMAYISSL